MMDDSNPFGPPPPPSSLTNVLDSKPLKVPPKKRTRRKKSKKPKDMPRRPLSAYNIFFKEERSRLLKEIEDGNDVLGTEGKSQGLFALMGKSIAKKWKSLTKEEMVKYTDAAKEDLKRYRSEMDEYQILVTQKCRVEEEQKSEELEDFDIKPPAAVAQQQQQHPFIGGLIDPQQLHDPAAYSRLREFQLREASHQTDVSRLLAAGRPDLATQVAMAGGFGGAGGPNNNMSSMFGGSMGTMQVMPQFRNDGMQQQQQQQSGDTAAANRSTMDNLSQQLGVTGPQLLQYLQEDALRRQIERERQLQLEILLRQQQQQQFGGTSSTPASNDQQQQQAMMQMMQQQQQQRGGSNLQNQQLQFLMMQQQFQQQQQTGGQNLNQQQQQLTGDNDNNMSAIRSSDDHTPAPPQNKGEDSQSDGGDDDDDEPYGEEDI